MKVASPRLTPGHGRHASCGPYWGRGRPPIAELFACEGAVAELFDTEDADALRIVISTEEVPGAYHLVRLDPGGADDGDDIELSQGDDAKRYATPTPLDELMDMAGLGEGDEGSLWIELEWDE